MILLDALIAAMPACFYLGRRFERRSLTRRGLLWRSREIDVSGISAERIEQVTAMLPAKHADPMVQQYLELRRTALAKRRKLGQLPQALEEWYSVSMHDLRGLLTPKQSNELDAELRQMKDDPAGG